MGKIRVTESELKQIIRESVEATIMENMAEDYASRMAKRNDKYNAAASEMEKFRKKWEEMTPEEKAPWIGNSGNDSNGKYTYEGAKQTAERKLKRATRRNGYNFQQQLSAQNGEKEKLQQQITQLQGELNTANQNVTKLQGDLNTANQTVGSCADAFKQIAQALKIKIPDAIQAPGAQTATKTPAVNTATQATTAPKTVVAEEANGQGVNGLQQILAAIKKLQTSANLVPGLQNQVKQLTAQNQSLGQRITNTNQPKIAPISNPGLAGKATTTTPAPQPGLAGPKPGTAQA